MSSTKKGNANTGVDADSDVTHSLQTSTAQLHEIEIRSARLHD